MIPNLFKKIPIPNQIPKELNTKIKEFSKSRDREVFLKKSFFYIVNNWSGSRVNLICKFSNLFFNFGHKKSMSILKIWIIKSQKFCAIYIIILRT